MQVRSVTLGVPNSLCSTRELEVLGARLGSLRDELVALDLPVETIRVSFEPVLGETREKCDAWHDKIGPLGDRLAGLGINYFTLPFWTENLALVPQIVQAIADHDLLFTNLDVLGEAGTISGPRIKLAAGLIRSLAVADPFYNLRFCASARAIPNTPFFPAAYHDSRRARPALAVALEAADEIVAAAKQWTSGGPAEGNFAPAVQARMQDAVGEVLKGVASTDSAEWADFLGIDLSPAPFPETRRSIGHALELASGIEFGDPAILGTIAEVVAGLRQVEGPRWGFNGVMLPVLEDTTIALRAREGKVAIETLLLYSAVCGTGLDTVPLPGDTCDGDLQQLIYSIAVLATQLSKPLTARLMPIPGKQAGDATAFSFEYFANSAVLKVPRKNCVRLLGCSSC